MRLRVPDYYSLFQCTAGWCKDSCCIGWEIDIDEETYEYYQNTDGEIGRRLREVMYQTKEGDMSFRLGKKGRCPFLNSENLCDICTCMGEEALSEVCTEYPRFSLWYGDVQQKCLSLSCEEVGRLLFTRLTPVEFEETDIPMEFSAPLEGQEEDAFAWDEEEALDGNLQNVLEQVQEEAIHILQNRTLSMEERMGRYLAYLNVVQEELNRMDTAQYGPDEWTELSFDLSDYAANGGAGNDSVLLHTDYEQHRKRMEIFEELEVLDEEWNQVKIGCRNLFSSDNYEALCQEFCKSGACIESDYEQLMVYFTFRYLMNSYYNLDVLSYGKLAVVFTRMIQDMDVLRYVSNGDAFSRVDRVDTARIFSKEVEHSEENVEYVREELVFLTA